MRSDDEVSRLHRKRSNRSPSLLVPPVDLSESGHRLRGVKPSSRRLEVSLGKLGSSRLPRSQQRASLVRERGHRKRRHSVENRCKISSVATRQRWLPEDLLSMRSSKRSRGDWSNYICGFDWRLDPVLLREERRSGKTGSSDRRQYYDMVHTTSDRFQRVIASGSLQISHRRSDGCSLASRIY